jgi:hypothetical protein
MSSTPGSVSTVGSGLVLLSVWPQDGPTDDGDAILAHLINYKKWNSGQGGPRGAQDVKNYAG